MDTKPEECDATPEKGTVLCSHRLTKHKEKTDMVGVVVQGSLLYLSYLHFYSITFQVAPSGRFHVCPQTPNWGEHNHHTPLTCKEMSLI